MDEAHRTMWISVKDKLPEESDYYIVRITTGNVTSFWYSEKNGWRTDKKDQITHWIPFPKFPKEDNDNGDKTDTV